MKVIFKEELKTLLLGLLVGILFSTACLSVSAYSIAESAIYYYDAAGINYSMQNEIYTGRNIWNEAYASAYTQVLRTNNTVIPAGWAGVLPRLFNSSGTLVEQGDWLYSPSGVVGIGSSTMESNASGARYSNGLSRAWKWNLLFDICRF